MAVLVDYHCHTDISRDSRAPYWDMVMAEYQAGVRELCITDHCDTVDWESMSFYPPCRQVARKELEAYQSVQDRLPEDLHLAMGIELAELVFYPDLGKELSAPEWLDFVLGSYHISREYGDYHCQDYTDPAHCQALIDVYLRDLQFLANLNCFDVLAHMGYFSRYAFYQGVEAGLTIRAHGDRIQEILRTLIQNGKGIELNCSGIRDGCGPFPSEEILRLYRELGGEMVTVGSDAHRPEEAAKCVDQGLEIIKSCGFRYVTVFRHRKPVFITIK